MIILLRVSSLVLLVLVISATTVRAHHAFSPVYDGKQTVTVSGVVAQFRFVNPHAMLDVDVTDETGKVAKWVMEFPGRLNLSEWGWTEQSLTPGELVTVTGNPTHTPSQRMSFVRIDKADGAVLLRARTQRADALEEERRERAAQRNQQQ